MKLFFTKMEGLGNDFILLDDRNQTIEKKFSAGNLAVKLCNRRFGIGGDGLIILSDSLSCDLKFRIFNPDGSEAQMCGNGMRCFAKYAYSKGITSKTEFSVETLAGKITPQVFFSTKGKIDSIRVDMGEPVIKASNVPFISANETAIAENIETRTGNITLTAVSMGNPHAVIFVNNIKDAPVTLIGPELETNRLFPEKTNVEFVEVVSKTQLKMRVWERGAGVTPACGTGACASLVAAVLNGKTENRVTVGLDGGLLDIEWNRKNNHIYKTGGANLVFEGHLFIDD